ncbi:hypothetical protein AVEN_33736-1 [Araneus ventricosus]|uniref:Uncharacterized protein n=1 Tax=Araneus ventricosus TaxID=182803 RepID=A0A4Y2KHE7_ARAVE|nr:hypothetical protein AVEN_33736-1 [Araneus ventricosus]
MSRKRLTYYALHVDDSSSGPSEQRKKSFGDSGRTEDVHLQSILEVLNAGRFLVGSLPIAMVLMTRLSENFCRSSSIMTPGTLSS